MASTSTTFNRENLRGFILESVLQAINEVITTAEKYQGTVFGGFVRDVILPRRKDPNVHVSFNNVDLWFVNDDDANKFTEVMGNKLEWQETNEYTIYDRRQYVLIVHGTEIAVLNIVISPVKPCNDFNVNGSTKSTGYRSDNGTDIINDILNRRMSCLPSCWDILRTDTRRSRALVTRMNKFMDRGWEIRIPSLISISKTHNVPLADLKNWLVEEHINCSQCFNSISLAKFVEILQTKNTLSSANTSASTSETVPTSTSETASANTSANTSTSTSETTTASTSISISDLQRKRNGLILLRMIRDFLIEVCDAQCESMLGLKEQ